MPRFSLCVLCNYDRSQVILAPCGHRIHAACATSWPLVQCPQCFKSVTEVVLLEEDIYMDNGFRGTLRNGRWTIEEEHYSEALIDEFTTGRLPLCRGYKLAHFLAEVLGRTPAGIRRKFMGCKSILYGGFQNISDSFRIDAILAGQKNFRELESYFLISLSCQSSSNKAFEELSYFFYREWQVKLVKFLKERGQNVTMSSKASTLCPVSEPPFDRNSQSIEQLITNQPKLDLTKVADSTASVCDAHKRLMAGTYETNIISSNSPQMVAVKVPEMDENRKRQRYNFTCEDDEFKKFFLGTSSSSYPDISFSGPQLKMFKEPKLNILHKEDELIIAEAWRNQHQLLTREQLLKFDNSLFDQACNLIYTYKSMNLINPAFDEDAVIPIICKLLSSCSSESTIWFMSLKHNYRVCFVSDGIEAMGVKRAHIEGGHVFNNNIMKTIFHPKDKASYFEIYTRCQENIKQVAEYIFVFFAQLDVSGVFNEYLYKVVEEATLTGGGMAPFHQNVDKWLNNTTTMRYRYDPLKDGWLDLVLNGYKPSDKEYNGFEQVQCFCTDKFWLCKDIQLNSIHQNMQAAASNRNATVVRVEDVTPISTSPRIPTTISPGVISPSESSPVEGDFNECFQLTVADQQPFNPFFNLMQTDLQKKNLHPKLQYSDMPQPVQYPVQEESFEEDPDMWHVISGILAKDETFTFG